MAGWPVADDEQFCDNANVTIALPRNANWILHSSMQAVYLVDTAKYDLIYDVGRLGLAFIALTFGLILQYLLLSCKHDFC